MADKKESWARKSLNTQGNEVQRLLQHPSCSSLYLSLALNNSRLDARYVFLRLLFAFSLAQKSNLAGRRLDINIFLFSLWYLGSLASLGIIIS